MIYHTYSHYVSKNPETNRRMALAKRTWDIQPWIDLPIPEDGRRVVQDHAGTVPFIRDIIGAAIKDKMLHDIIVLTNSDTCVRTDCAQVIVASLMGSTAIYSFRRDFTRLNAPIPDQTIKTGVDYLGCDLFAFRVAWWRCYEGSFPDMLLGRETWDCIMRLLIGWTNHGCKPAIPDLIYHERHPTIWENPKYRVSIPSQLHNLRLAKQWLARFNVNPGLFGIR